MKEDGLITYFEDTWVAEKERRHSVVKEINVRDSDIYKNNRPPPLFYGKLQFDVVDIMQFTLH